MKATPEMKQQQAAARPHPNQPSRRRGLAPTRIGQGREEPRINTLPRIPPRLEIAPADSPAEREADRATEQMQHGGKADTARTDQPGRLHRKADTHQGGTTAPAHVATQIAGARGNGGSLYHSLRQKLAHTFDADFSHVKVHDDPKAHALSAQLQAKAFTVGDDMFFGKGQYAPSTPEGDRLIAHEAAHVVQGGEVVRRKIDPNTTAEALPATDSSVAETNSLPAAVTPHEGLDLPAGIETLDYFGYIKTDRSGFHFTGSLGQHPTEPNADPKKNNYNYGVGPKGDLPINTKVRVLGRSPEGLLFVYAMTPNGLMTGWVSHELITEIGEVTWAYTGNYTPGAKVRNPEAPNFAFVENPTTQTERRRLVKAVQSRQESRAKGYTASGDVVDGRYWFTKVYSFVTKREIEIMDNNNLHYPSLNMLAVLLFDKLYEDNLKRFDATAEHLMTDAHWKTAFETIAFNDKVIKNRWWSILTLNWPVALASIIGLPMYYAILSLVEGMIAHIRFDLPRALNYAFDEHLQSMHANKRYMDKFTFFAGESSYRQPTINDYLPDFMASTYVFEMAMQDMIQEMNKHFAVPADKFPPRMMDISMDQIFDADMNSERADTWSRAEALSRLKESSPYTFSITKGFIGDVTAKDKTAGLNLLGKGLKPDMEASRSFPDKAVLRDQILNSADEDLKMLSTMIRIRMLRELTTEGVMALIGVEQANTTIKGALNYEKAIFKLLQISKEKGDLVTTVNGVGYWFLIHTLGKDNLPLRTFMQEYYLEEVDVFSAIAVINRAKMVDDQATIDYIRENHPEGARIYTYYLTHVAPKS